MNWRTSCAEVSWDRWFLNPAGTFRLAAVGDISYVARAYIQQYTALAGWSRVQCSLRILDGYSVGVFLKEEIALMFAYLVEECLTVHWIALQAATGGGGGGGEIIIKSDIDVWLMSLPSAMIVSPPWAASLAEQTMAATGTGCSQGEKHRLLGTQSSDIVLSSPAVWINTHGAFLFMEIISKQIHAFF